MSAAPGAARPRNVVAGVRAGLVRAALLTERELRAHPRLFEAFYRGLNRSAGARAVIGAAKARARSHDAQRGAAARAPEAPLVAQLRQRAVAVRLGLDIAADSPPRGDCR